MQQLMEAWARAMGSPDAKRAAVKALRHLRAGRPSERSEYCLERIAAMERVRRGERLVTSEMLEMLGADEFEPCLRGALAELVTAFETQEAAAEAIACLVEMARDARAEDGMTLSVVLNTPKRLRAA